jgi:hypothetical protein
LMILSILHTGHHPVFQHWCVRTSMGCYPHFILPMRSSRGFASAAANWDAPFGLAFASAPVQSTLTWLTTASRRIIMQKARRHPQGCPRRAPTACRRVVSGSVSSPDRGSSHLSLALLGSLSVAREYLALGDGPPGFRPTFTCSVLLRCRLTDLPLPRTGLSPAVAEHSRTLPLGYKSAKCRSYNPTRTSPGGLG